ncbi:MAG: 1-deoxy-D-xylulose-5-phosphate synthase [Coriobacteriales bacterium]|jgi:1-deoxy-D-xylulose-5-phosphate synthase|nr:1-deoxy-D-xylulose-5-phosphate synthase [Coriobacteriales bacterium]
MADDPLKSLDSASLRSASERQLNTLAQRIRERMIEVTAQTGGHLASSLGAVEIILAMHSVFDFPADKLVFDVGHQAYAHKIITGRNEALSSLRSLGGLSGFTRREESVFDTHDSGHASDALSIAAGLALSRDLNGTSEQIVVLIGDASLSGGMAFEALNQIGNDRTDITIVLNDNEMSISRNVGALSLYLAKARMSRPYTQARDTVEGKVSSMGKVGKFLVNAGEAAKGSVKKLVVPGMFFEDMGITYIGPIDGHNVAAVKAALRAARKSPGPVLIHAVTQKGHGYPPAEAQPDVFHGVGCFDPTSGQPSSKADCQPSFTQAFSQALLKQAERNERIVAITAAMADGTGLSAFRRRYGRRFVDVGIAEEHAVTLAAGLALGGQLPVVAIYSTFLQRAFDQVATNVALQNLHVVFAVDRAGLVGEDGTTHHGLFDLAWLRCIPNMRILAPADNAELRDALETALGMDDGPIALRYPRGSVEPLPGNQEPRAAQKLPVGKAIKLRDGRDASLLAVGRMVGKALATAELLAAQGIEAAVYNMRWVKPLDEAAVAEAAAAPLVVTLEEGTTVGGFGSAVLECLAARQFGADKTGAPGGGSGGSGDGGFGSAEASSSGDAEASGCDSCCADASSSGGDCPRSPRVLVLGIPDEFVTHGSTEQLFGLLGLQPEQLARSISDALSAQTAT